MTTPNPEEVLSSRVEDDSTLFRVMATFTKQGPSLRVETSPRMVVRMLEELSPSAITALMLLVEDSLLADFRRDPPREGARDDVATLVANGMQAEVARAGLSELATKGYLPDASLPFTPRPSLTEDVRPTPIAGPRRRKCSVCGGLIPLVLLPDQITYAVARERWVKIGTTRNLDRRLKMLRKPHGGAVLLPEEMNPTERLVLLGTMTAEEHSVHERFAAHHAAGEWFHDSPSLRAGIEELVAQR